MEEESLSPVREEGGGSTLNRKVMRRIKSARKGRGKKSDWCGYLHARREEVMFYRVEGEGRELG